MNIELEKEFEKTKLFGKKVFLILKEFCIDKNINPLIAESLIKIGRRNSNGCEACYIAYGYNKIQTSYSLSGTSEQKDKYLFFRDK